MTDPVARKATWFRSFLENSAQSRLRAYCACYNIFSGNGLLPTGRVRHRALLPNVPTELAFARSVGSGMVLTIAFGEIV